jgi:hypothetical protein
MNPIAQAITMTTVRTHPCKATDPFNRLRGGDISSNELGDARMRFSERRMVEALHHLEAANMRCVQEQAVDESFCWRAISLRGAYHIAARSEASSASRGPKSRDQ